MSEYKDYNWNDDDFTNAHGVFMTPIIKMLPTDGSPILDVGCGNGAFANYLISKGYNVFGTDASISGIEIANKKNPQHFFVQDLAKDELPIQLQHIQFKTIISTEVIEHLYDPRKYIAFCKSILEKSSGGNLIISTPYHGFLKNLALSVFDAWDRHLTVLWDGGHIKFWSFNTLSKLLKEYNFEILAFKGCGRFPYLWHSMVINSKIKVE
ncbi:class I SAM-dependent methyltransferase [Gaetbulibacter aquiaggeris]|uniref:Class I SAM-dependent methyltransferase n=1 Tax=Gaetbulibacter aquiaggeris TaxID=1735373 RepID=A0ABW7MRT8_9FLAO